jgi:hypothetical protein
MAEPAIVLSRWADAELRRLAEATGSEKIAALNGATLLGERAALNHFPVPGLVSAGGGCRLYKTCDGWVALNLARPDDRDLLPALFESDKVDDVAANMASVAETEIVARGREMGLAISGIGERGHGPASIVMIEGDHSPLLFRGEVGGRGSTPPDDGLGEARSPHPTPVRPSWPCPGDRAGPNSRRGGALYQLFIHRFG